MPYAPGVADQDVNGADILFFTYLTMRSAFLHVEATAGFFRISRQASRLRTIF